MCRLAELKCKEVINVKTGNKLGYISDIEFDVRTGQICSFILPGEGKLFGVFGKGDDIFIPFCNIEKIGDDVILVCIEE